MCTLVSNRYLLVVQKVRRINAASNSFKFRMAAIAAADLCVNEQWWGK